jgi:hypothetical protein
MSFQLRSESVSNREYYAIYRAQELIMNVEFEALLHPRVLRHCESLVNSGHYKHAALEAMTQVELALKEKSG